MRYFPLRFFPEKTHFDFIGHRWFGFMLTIIGMTFSAYFMTTRGLNYGIDFTGGLLLETRAEQTVDLAKMRGLFGDGKFGEVSLQELGSDKDVMIRVKLEKDANQAKMTQEIQTMLKEHGYELEYRKVDYVGPTVGQEMIEKGALAMGLAVLGIMAYLWFRFEWQYGAGGVLALLHDLIMMLGFYAFTQYEFGLSSVAAVLTILGYSINDSVVIYDRIRENLRKYRKMPLIDLLNLSLNETLSRTILTVVTTFLAVLSLVLVGGEVIRSFSACVLFGLIVGTHSSIYVSATVLIYLRLRNTDEAPSKSTLVEAR